MNVGVAKKSEGRSFASIIVPRVEEYAECSIYFTRHLYDAGVFGPSKTASPFLIVAYFTAPTSLS